MRGVRFLSFAVVMAAVCAVGGCGGNDGDDKKGSGAKTGNASSMRCLILSVYAPKRYPPGATEEDGVERGVEPLLTKGAKGGEILTGRPDGPGAVVIEYPDAAAASAALRKARKSRKLAQYVDPERVRLIERTLVIDYTAEPELRQVIQACATHPEKPPPTPG
jgi:hypothetical protein